MIEKIMNNFGWKFLSLVLAFLLWLIVVNYEDPLTTRVFTDITVEKINVQAITSEKKAIEYKDGQTVTIRLRGKRSVLNRMTSSDIYAFADLENLSITGAIDIQVEVADSISVLEKQPAMMRVELENIITVQKEVQYYMEGEPKEGFIYLDPIITPNNIEIEGPESKIGLIKSVLVPVKIDGVTRDVTLYGAPQIIDDANRVILGLTNSANQIQIQVPIEKKKTIDISQKLADKVADGYELVGITLSQKSLNIRGKENLVDNVDSLTITNIDISRLTENTTLKVSVVSLLPQGISVYEDAQTIEVYLEIEPIVEKTIEVTHTDIIVRRLPEDMQFSYVQEISYMLTFRGISSKLEDVDIERISPSITLIDLEEGLHELELSFYEPFGVELVSEKPVVEIELIKVIIIDPEVNPDANPDEDVTPIEGN